MNFEIKKYSPEHKKTWDDLISLSKNATFLLYRNYMDYHMDRFNDHSLLIFHNSQLVALFPATISNDQIVSHGGLTYGGLLYTPSIGAEDTIRIMEAIIDYYYRQNFKSIYYKSIPHIYHKIPSEEDIFAITFLGFNLVRRDISSTISFNNQTMKGKKINGAKRAIKEGFSFEETDDSKGVIDVFNHSLIEKYQKLAVHTPNELNRLRANFKTNIKFFNLTYGDEIHGGAILFIANSVVHTQYVATSLFAKKNRGLDLIIYKIFEIYSDTFTWFDFGISTENDGRYLNTPLIKSKEEFNFRGICYDSYYKQL
jgi:hypothetical protein